MDNAPSGVRLSRGAFVQSLAVLAALMLLAGLLTRLVPAGVFDRHELEGRVVIDPESYRQIERPDYPVWRWVTAPFELMATDNGLIVLVIVVFLLFVGVAFAVLEKCGIVGAFLSMIVLRFRERRHVLLLLISLAFMLMGAFFGTLEEIILLVPVMVALSYSLGWDALVGMGMSVLAANMGFSAAVTNPFTIGVAQHLAGLPLFSGAWLRIIVFVAVYVVLALFLLGYARRLERNPASSLLKGADAELRHRYASLKVVSDAAAPRPEPHHLGRGLVFFGAALVLIVGLLVLGVVVPAFTRYTLPAVGIVFLVGGLGAALMAGADLRLVGRGAWEGASGILPAVPLILMAAAVGHIVTEGRVLDTLLHAAFQPFARLAVGPARPVVAALVLFVAALAIELLIASGSAKAFLMMPVLLPLADLIGVTRQVAVTAYAFGDGFSNLVYPTNPALIICLGLASVGYPVWMRWTARLWVYVLGVTVGFLVLAAALGFGPF